MRHGARDFSGHERLAPARRLMVKQNSIGSVYAVGFPIVDGDPMGKNFGASIRAAWIKWGYLRLRHLLDQAEHLAGRSLIKAAGHARLTNRFQQSDGAGCSNVRGIFRDVEADADMTLRGQIINLVRLNLSDQARQSAGICQVAIMQMQAAFVRMRVFVNRIQPPRIESARAADDSMHLVSFG